MSGDGVTRAGHNGATVILNGILAPPLLVLVMLVSSNPNIMGERTNGPWLNILGWTATVLMTAAAFFVTSL
ncbi:MAG: hypothetical protein HYU25_06045 [Candidatus Rokubacteria bacterium]|nr:hypothetical protein [Candidatus Rokubacteria bacterium]